MVVVVWRLVKMACILVSWWCGLFLLGAGQEGIWKQTMLFVSLAGGSIKSPHSVTWEPVLHPCILSRMSSRSYARDGRRSLSVISEPSASQPSSHSEDLQWHISFLPSRASARWYSNNVLVAALWRLFEATYTVLAGCITWSQVWLGFGQSPTHHTMQGMCGMKMLFKNLQASLLININIAVSRRSDCAHIGWHFI